MSLKEVLDSNEAVLKGLIDRLCAARPETPALRRERERTLHELSTRLIETRTRVDEMLSGLTRPRRNALEYRIRVEYPLFSLLDQLASLSSEFVDWSVRDFSLTTAAAQ